MNEHLRSYGERLRCLGGSRAAAEEIAGELATSAADAVDFVMLCVPDLLWLWYRQEYDHYENYVPAAGAELPSKRPMPPDSRPVAGANGPLISGRAVRPQSEHPVMQERGSAAVALPPSEDLPAPPRLVGGRAAIAHLLQAPVAIRPGKRIAHSGEMRRGDLVERVEYMQHLRHGLSKSITFCEMVMSLYQSDDERLSAVFQRIIESRVYLVPKLLAGLTDMARLPLPESA